MAAKEIALKVTVDTSEVKSEVKQTTKDVKKLGATTKQTSKEMSTGFDSAANNAKSLGGSMGGAAGAAVNFAMGIKSMTKSALAFIATPLGAVIAAIVAVGATLVSFFKSSEEGQQKLRVISAALSAVWDNMTDVLANLGEALMKVFSGDFMGALETAKNSFNSLGTEMIRDVKLAIELEQAMNALKVSERELGVERAKVLKQVAEARLAAEDETKSAEERVDALKEAARLEGDLAAREQANAEEKLRILKAQAELAKSDEETLKGVAEAEAEVYRVQLSSLNLNRRLKTEINSLEREIETERQQRNEAVKARAKEREDQLIKEQIELEKIADLEFKLLDERVKKQAEIEEYIAERRTLNADEELQAAIDAEWAKFQAVEMALNQIDASYEEKDQLRLEAKMAYDETEMNIINDHNAKKVQAEADAQKAINDTEIKSSQLRIELATKEKDARLAVASSMVGSLGTLVGALAGQSKASVAIQKTLAVAQIAIDTARSISSAIAGATAAAAATGPGAVIATPLFIATQIATVLTAVGQAAGILASVPGGGGGGVPSVSVPSSAPAPTIQGVTTNTTELGNTEQAELQPIQAFVVETSLTGTQNNVSQIEGQATFG